MTAHVPALVSPLKNLSAAAVVAALAAPAVDSKERGAA